MTTALIEEPVEGPAAPDARGTQGPSQTAGRGPRGRPRGRGRSRGGRGASRGGSSSQPPQASASMVGSEDEVLELPRAGKVFHSITYGKEVSSCAILWEIRF